MHVNGIQNSVQTHFPAFMHVCVSGESVFLMSYLKLHVLHEQVISIGSVFNDWNKIMFVNRIQNSV